MRVRIEYTVDVSDEIREAINLHFGKEGKATNGQVKDWYRRHGSSMDDDLMMDWQAHHDAQKKA